MKKSILLSLSISMIMMFGFGAVASAQTEVWVNTSYAEDGDNDGHSWGEIAFDTIQAGINAVDPGGTVHVAAGTYDETINVNKRVSIIGEGSGENGTILVNTATQSDFTKLPGVPGVTYPTYRPNVILNASGLDIDHPILLKNLRIGPRQNIGYPRPAIILQPGNSSSGYVASYSFIELDNIKIIGHVSDDTSGSAGPPKVNPVSANEWGFALDGSTNLYHLVVKNCEFTDMRYGMIFFNNENNPSTAQFIHINDTIFARNSVKGFYAEKLSDATFNNIQIIDNGNIEQAPYYWVANNAGLDINLKYGDYQTIVLNDLTVNGNGLGSKEGMGLGIKARDDGNYSSKPATLNNVQINGGTFTGNERGIRFGEPGVNNVGPTDVVVRNAVITGNVQTYAGSDGSEYGALINQTQSHILAENNWWGTADGVQFSGLISGDVDFSGWSLDGAFVSFANNETATILVDDDWAGSVDYTPIMVGDTEYYLGINAFATIQEGINAVDQGGTVNVAAGTYNEYILIDKPLTLRGATAEVNKNGYKVPTGYMWDDTVESIINHPDPGGGYITIVDIYNTGNVTFEGFVIQELNAEANKNSSLLRVRAQTQPVSSVVVRNNVIGPNTNVTSQDGTHGRMGLYLVNNPYSDQYGIVDSTFAGNKIFGCEGNGNNVFIWSSYHSYGALGPASMSGTVIEDNEISGAHRSGIETSGGFSDLTIRNNSIYGNYKLEGDDPGLKYGNGIVMIRGSSDRTADGYGPVDVTIEGNEIYDNDGHGIYMGPNNKGITITGNQLYNNGIEDDKGAITVDLIGHYWNPDFDTGPGPYTNLSGSVNVSASLNSIYNNGGYGVQVIGTPTNDFVLDAKNNYWGDNNPSDDTSESVIYTPWREAETIPPTITLKGNSPVTVEVGSSYTDAGATGSDNIDGDITANIVTVNTVDINTVGTYTVTYNVSDAAGNAATEVTRTVNVVDTTPPTIILSGNSPVTVELGTSYNDASATASDNYDGNITANIVTVNTVDINTVGTYTVTYNVSDAAGNAATEVTRTVNVVDTTDPVIIIKTPADSSHISEESPTLLFSVNEINEGTTEVKIKKDDGDETVIDKVSGDKLDTPTSGVYTVSVTHTDGVGNTGTAQSTFSVILDETPPVAKFIKVPSGVINKDVSVSVGGIDVVSYLWKLDSNPWPDESEEIPVGTKFQLTGLTDEEHTVYIIGKDAAGNWQAEADATTATFTVDTTPPAEVTLTNAPQAGSTVGTTSIDVKVGGPGVRYYKSRIDFNGNSWDPSDDSWSPAYPVSIHIRASNLAEGNHTLDVICADAVGNWQEVVSDEAEEEGNRITWTINTETPTAVLSNLPDHITNQTSVRIDVSGTEDIEVDAYYYRINDGTWTFGNVTDSIDIGDPDDLDDGIYTLYVNARGINGVWQYGEDGLTTDNATTYVWKVDTTGPDPVVDLSATTGTPASSTVVLSWTAPLDANDLSRYEIRYSKTAVNDGDADEAKAAWWSNATALFARIRPADAGNQEVFTVRKLQPATTYYFAVRSVDMPGNISDTSNVASKVLGSERPTITAISSTGGDNSVARELTISGSNLIVGKGNIVRFFSSTGVFDVTSKAGNTTETYADVPAGAPVGSYRLKVINDNGVSALSNATYTVEAAPIPLPQVTGVTPVTGPADADTIITISGDYFGGTTDVSLVSEAGTSTSLNIFSEESATKITATVPGGSTFDAGIYNIQVTTENGTNGVSAVKFEVYEPEVLTGASLNPVATTGGVDMPDDGIVPVEVTISTDDREEVAPVSANTMEIEVTIDPGTEITMEDGTSYSGTIDPPRQVPVRDEITQELENVLGTDASSAVVFTMGNPDMRLDLDQTMFVKVDIAVPSTALVPIIYYLEADGTLTPAGVVGEKDGVTFSPGGTILATQVDVPEEGYTTYTFGLLLDHMSEYVGGPGAAPTIDQIDPEVGYETGGANVTITGSNFVDGATVTFGGVSATNINVTSSEITCDTPAVSAGSVNVVVTNPDTQSATIGFEFVEVVTITDKPSETPDVESGESSVFNVTGGSGTYNWYVTGPENVESETGSSFTFTAPTEGNFAGRYTITVTDRDNPGFTDTIEVNVPLKITPDTLVFYEKALDGQSNPQTFTVTGTSAGSTYKWEILSSETATIAVSNPGDYGTWSSDTTDVNTNTFTPADKDGAKFYIRVMVVDDSDLTGVGGIYTIVPLRTYTVILKDEDGVIDGSGLNQGEITVTVQVGDTDLTESLTSANGQVTFLLPDTDSDDYYQYEVKDKRSSPVYIDRVSASTDAKSLSITLEFVGPYDISGVVKDTAGSPIEGVTVTALQSSDISETYTATTAADGSYTINLPDGASTSGWVVIASHSDYVSKRLIDQTVGAVNFAGENGLQLKTTITSITATTDSGTVRLDITASPSFSDIFEVAVSIVSGSGSFSYSFVGSETVRVTYSTVENFTVRIKADTSEDYDPDTGYYTSSVFKYIAGDTATGQTHIDIDAGGGTKALTSHGQTITIEVPVDGLAKDATIIIKQIPKVNASSFATVGSPLYLYEVTALDVATGNALAPGEISRVNITLPIDLSVIKADDLDDGTYVIYRAEDQDTLEIGDGLIIPVANIIRTDYVGDGQIGSVTFWVVSLSVFGIGSSEEPSKPAPDDTGDTNGGGGGCFIATAAYGTPSERHVVILRQFRDVYLLPNRLGTAFVELYYKHSPPIADRIAENEGMRAAVRTGLLPLVGVSYVALHTSPFEKGLIFVLMMGWAAGMYILIRRSGKGLLEPEKVLKCF